MVGRWQRMVRGTMLISCGMLLSPAFAAKPEDVGEETPQPGYEQVETIDLDANRDGAQINTFCLDVKGRLLVAVGGTQVITRLEDGERSTETKTSSNAVRVYSEDGEFLEAWPLEFPPQAINLSPDGNIFVAGTGHIAQLDNDGKVVKSAETPQLGTREEMQQALDETIESQKESYARMFERQVERAEELLERLEKTPEEDRSKIDEARIKSAKKHLESVQKMAEDQTESLVARLNIDLDTFIAGKQKVPGLAVTKQDVFFVMRSLKGYGYDLWRLDHSLANPKKIAEGMRGCCGQMDIQAGQDSVFVAENSRHRVCKYDRDGKLVCDWGQSDRTGEDGFAGCCNPMNLRITPGGDVLTGESSVGTIKRYSVDGDYLGVMGTAELQGGCKHVALAIAPDNSRLYMLDVTRDRIAVLKPKPADSTNDALEKAPTVAEQDTDEAKK